MQIAIAVAIGVAIIAFGILISLAIARSINRSIVMLQKKTREIAQGRYLGIPSLDSPPEIQALADDFNRMSGRLKQLDEMKIDFINRVEEGVALINDVGRANMRLMPDVFHMNIEDVSIGGELARHIGHVGYIHLADSNRLAPGQGHTDFEDLFNHLVLAAYDGWVSVEILPKPDPDTAARQAADFLRPRIDRYNARSRTRHKESVSHE